jgi:ribosomal protein S18 acetylase RimI-like enzyme
MTHYAPINEPIRLSVITDVSDETRSALAAFCRRNGFPYLYFEILEPLLSRTHLILAIAAMERPWPPKGIGSQTIEALGVAMIGSEGRAYLTPVLTDVKHATNLGLASAVTKQLLETLRARKVPSVGYLVREGDRAIERALEQAGFRKADLRAATEYAEYLEHSAQPQKVLETLGLKAAKIGDVLALAFDGPEIDRLGTYQFTLAAGLAPYLWDSIQYLSILPGLIDLIAASPPGGVPPGTAPPEIGIILGVEE